MGIAERSPQSLGCYLLSFSHHQLQLEEREQLSRVSAWLPQLTNDHPEVAGLVWLSTCNRLELYYCAGADQRELLLPRLAALSGLSQQRLLEAGKYRTNLSLLRHLLALACGLDSMILGEGQILGQLKQAYRRAQEQGRLPSELSNYFEYALLSARKIRQETGVDRHPVSLAYAAVQLARHLFGDLAKLDALIIGAGANAHNIAQCLQSADAQRLRVCNRTAEHGQAIADAFGAQVIAWDELEAQLDVADIIVSSTASPDLLLHKAAIEAALQRRRHRPLFMVDLSLPRDIDPEAKQLEDVYLYAIDDLQHVLDQNLSARQQAAQVASARIEHDLDNFVKRVPAAGHHLRLYRQQLDKLRAASLAEVRELLRRGLDADAALERLAQLLTQRIGHGPSNALKRLEGQSSLQLLELLTQDLLAGRQANLNYPDAKPEPTAASSEPDPSEPQP